MCSFTSFAIYDVSEPTIKLSQSDVAAVIVCGGESRRMGRPKAWLPFGSETLLERVVRLASCVARPVVVVAASVQSLPELSPDVIVVRDEVPGRGPLQGLASGFAAVPRSVELAYATACDAPFLEPCWITHLTALIDTADLAIPYVHERFHPLSALYRVAGALPVIEELLVRNGRRVVELVELLDTRVVSADELALVDPAFGTLININTPEEYQAAFARVE